MRHKLLSLLVPVALLLVVLVPSMTVAQQQEYRLFLPYVSSAPAPEPTYPAYPWLEQHGEVTYVRNDSQIWLQGKIVEADGVTPAGGYQVQICEVQNPDSCTGPSAATESGKGTYDWINFPYPRYGEQANGDYFAFIADCTGVTPRGNENTIGNWPRCEEHSPRVTFTIQFPEHAIANIDWIVVATEP